MADKETRRIKPAQLRANESAFAALLSISGYTPANPAYTLAKGSNLVESMQTTRIAEAQAEAALKAARDNATAAEWAMHNFMLGAKDQVAAQFGKNSNEYQSLGLKKKTEYKKPTKKPA